MIAHQEIYDLFSRLPAYDGQEVTAAGWLRTKRAGKTVLFLELNDGSCLSNLQVVADETTDGYIQAVQQNVGAALLVRGILVHTPQNKQPCELRAASIAVEGPSDAAYPLQKKRHSLEFLRTIAHLRARTNTFGAVFRIRSACALAIHRFFEKRRFVYVHTPLITSSDCEGAGEQFQVTALPLENPPKTPEGGVDYTADFFGKPTRLTVSGQLTGESLALALGNIYTFGPTFRAERSNTARHAAEFWMIEPEMAFADLEDDMALARDLLQEVVRYLLEHCGEDLRFCRDFYDQGLIDRLETLADSDFACITYTKAIDLLTPHTASFSYPVFWGCDLQTEHERFLTEQLLKRPVFVTDYPKEIKAFYMRLNDDGKTVAAMDLLVPGVGEIIGGSQREERLTVLEERIAQCGLNPADYDWYIDLRRYGSVRHAGFGLGFERLLMYVTGIGNIRDVLPFPRTTGSAAF